MKVLSNWVEQYLNESAYLLVKNSKCSSLSIPLCFPVWGVKTSGVYRLQMTIITDKLGRTTSRQWQWIKEEVLLYFFTYDEELIKKYVHSLIGESLGLVSVSRLKVPRLSVSSRFRTKFTRLSHLGLNSDEKFSDSLVSVSSRLLQFYSVSSRSRPDLDE